MFHTAFLLLLCQHHLYKTVLFLFTSSNFANVCVNHRDLRMVSFVCLYTTLYFFYRQYRFYASCVKTSSDTTDAGEAIYV